MDTGPGRAAAGGLDSTWRRGGHARRGGCSRLGLPALLRTRQLGPTPERTIPARDMMNSLTDPAPCLEAALLAGSCHRFVLSSPQGFPVAGGRGEPGMNEADTCRTLITPKLQAAGWD